MDQEEISSEAPSGVQVNFLNMVWSEMVMKVSLDLSLGAAANARTHFDKSKKHAAKEQKTHEANATALAAAEKTIQVIPLPPLSDPP